MNIRHEESSRPESFNAGNMEVRTIEPDFPQDLQLISAAQDGQDVVTSVFVVEFPQSGRFFFPDFRPEQSIQQVLGAEILDGLAAIFLHGDRTDEEFVL